MQLSITIEQKRSALNAVLGSDVFAPLERLRDFLSYIVDEDLAGRGENIRGKTIAQDVYGRGPGEQGDPENVVRVEARRLRQSLDHYYETAGRQDPVRIHVDTGGYRPRFEPYYVEEGADAHHVGRFAATALAFAAGVALGAAVMFFWPKPPVGAPDHALEARKALERQAIAEKSGAALQAVNLAEQAREMIYPIFDKPRQELVTEIFRRVIALDPDYVGGYAGAAQTLSTLAVLSPTGPERDSILEDANEMSATAIRLDPANTWAQSARSWTEFANGNFDESLRLARRSAQLAPGDSFVYDFYGTIALFTGNFKEAVDAAQSAWTADIGNRFANRNILAAASYHLGDFETSLETLTAAWGEGRPVSPPVFAFQAANLSALGRTEDAVRKVEELRLAWPRADLEAIFHGIYQHSEDAEAVLVPVRALGWSAISEPGATQQPTE